MPRTPLFDDSGHVISHDDLRTVGLAMSRLPRAQRGDGGTLREPWLNENDGKLGGVDTKHGDGRVDVDVLGRPLTNSRGT